MFCDHRTSAVPVVACITFLAMISTPSVGQTPEHAGASALPGWVNVHDFAPPEAKADGKFDWNSPEHP